MLIVELAILRGYIGCLLEMVCPCSIAVIPVVQFSRNTLVSLSWNCRSPCTGTEWSCLSEYPGGLLFLLILFAVMYIIGISQYICMTIVLCAGSGLVYKVYGMSNRYGEHGLMKELAKRSVPKVIKINSRKIFLKSDSNQHGKK